MHRKLLHEVPAREQNGRDAIARFKAQYRAAAFQCLGLLKDAEVVAIYCDLHDDYVIKRIKDGEEYYDFFQVKTNNKKGFQWKVSDIFGFKKIKEQVTSNILDSFFGKLMCHAVEFGDSCNTVNIQSNKDFNEDVYDIEGQFNTAVGTHKAYLYIKKEFKNIFPNSSSFDESDIEACLSKFKVEGASEIVDIEGVNYLPLSRHAICENSEVDLSLEEVVEIIIGLLGLVENKSSGIIEKWEKSEIDKHASVCLDDVLGLMTISPTAYRYLKDGGDANALKHTSIIQRFFQETNASDGLIEYLCLCKSQYDQWNSDRKHFLNEFDFNLFKADVNDMVVSWFKTGCGNKSFLKMANDYKRDSQSIIVKGMDANVVVGALLSEVVRQKI